MRYSVPQYVDIEDKIIGPFTLKQFLIYLTAVLVLIPVFLASDLSLFLTIAIPVLGVAALFAHLRLNGKNLFSVIGNALNFANRGQKFLWQRTNNPKFLAIQGEEYGSFSSETTNNQVSLADRARSLETSGKIVSEDADDPLSAERSPKKE